MHGHPSHAERAHRRIVNRNPIDLTEEEQILMGDDPAWEGFPEDGVIARGVPLPAFHLPARKPLQKARA